MWEDELFDEIQKGDKVWYCGQPDDDTVHGPVKALMIGPAGWVCDKGDGQPVVVNEGSNYLGHTPAKDKYYLFGQYFNKGGFYTNEVIQTGPDGIDFRKMKIRYENADGFRCFNEIEYDGTAYYLEEDSTGKSSSFYVMEGDDV